MSAFHAASLLGEDEIFTVDCGVWWALEGLNQH